MKKALFLNGKFRLLFAILLLAIFIFPAACNGESTTSGTTSIATSPTTSATPTTTTANTPTTKPTTTKPTATTSAPPRTTPPTVEELVEEHFLDPEIPRITAEQIKMIIDAAQAAGEYAGSGGMISWDNFVIIDARSSKGEVLGAPGFNQPGHILGARSMPMTWYWVTDPREDPKPEELQAYQLELDALENNITQLPKDMPIYIYDGTADDEAACIVARMILEAGFNPDNVKVIWKGFAYWYYDLRYPIVQGDYNFEGE